MLNNITVVMCERKPRHCLLHKTSLVSPTIFVALHGDLVRIFERRHWKSTLLYLKEGEPSHLGWAPGDREQ